MNDAPTKKQVEYIKMIEEHSSAPIFKGNTKQEASEYISKYKYLFELETTSTWVIKNGYF